LSSKECDLKSCDQTKSFLSKLEPKLIIHFAARVGGLFGNMADKVGFYEDNMAINMNVVKCAHESEV